MSKILNRILWPLLFCIGLGLSSCLDQLSIKVESVALDENVKIVEVGETFVLSATVLPADASDKSITWSTSDLAVATVEDGFVTAVSDGSVAIIVTTVDGSKTDICNVTVKAKVSVSLDKTSIELTEGDESELVATVLPENATNHAVVWTSSDEGIATVSEGKVKAVSPGTAVITVTTVDGGYSATCNVAVSARIFSVVSVSLDKTSLELTEGDESELVATVLPENATNPAVVWTSSDESIATVSEGKVKAVSPGTVVITVTTVDGGLQASCKVVVKKFSQLENPSEEKGEW